MTFNGEITFYSINQKILFNKPLWRPLILRTKWISRGRLKPKHGH